MNVSLARKVETGRYNSASEVVREALRLLEERDQSRDAQISRFNHELRTRLASLDRGEHANTRAVRERLDKKSRERRKISA